MIPLPIPGGGKMTLGLQRCSWSPCAWASCAVPALRLDDAVFGESGPQKLRTDLFLAQVGIASGPKFFATVGATGLTS
jgi:putative transport protein